MLRVIPNLHDITHPCNHHHTCEVAALSDDSYSPFPLALQDVLERLLPQRKCGANKAMQSLSAGYVLVYQLVGNQNLEHDVHICAKLATMLPGKIETWSVSSAGVRFWCHQCIAMLSRPNKILLRSSRTFGSQEDTGCGISFLGWWKHCLWFGTDMSADNPGG